MESCPALCLSDLSSQQLRGKKVLLRADLNVPLDQSTGRVTDDTRIRESLASIRYLTSCGARVLLCSHLVSPRRDSQSIVRVLTVQASFCGAGC
jgi:phosphoglycerate kinase